MNETDFCLKVDIKKNVNYPDWGPDLCRGRDSVKFGLVSLFNGISTFLGYLMPKLFSKKNSNGTI